MTWTFYSTLQVKSEARKLQELFFEIMKLAFPDADLREARNAVSFLGPVVGAGPLLSPSPRPTSTTSTTVKSPKPLPNDVSPPSLRIPVKPLGKDLAPFTHPGDLVIHKKKRKDREKSASLMQKGSPATVAAAAAAAALLGQNRAVASVPPPRPGQIPLFAGSARSRDGSLMAGRVSSSGTVAAAAQEAQWAKPVKKMRTDTGKRRPSHL